MAAVTSPAEDRARGAFGADWEFSSEGGETVARKRDGTAVLSARTWEVLGCLLAGHQAAGLRAEVLGRHP